jgi:pimeloyl-ACP methyl ester carboxylesterase
MDSIARQGAGESDGVTLDDLLAVSSGGPPRFFSPIVPSSSSSSSSSSRPMMLYVPGLDGTGFAASSQFESLSRHYDLVALNVPVGDRATFDELVALICDFLETERAARGHGHEESKSKPKSKSKAKRTAATNDPKVFLIGESMGGLLSLGVASRRPDLVDRLVLVNPASSFDKSPWPAVGPLLPNLPEQLYAGLPYALAPVLFDPPRLVQGAVAAAVAAAEAGAPGARGVAAATGDPVVGLAAAAEELARLFPALGQLSNIIPRDTLAHRLAVLADGCAAVNAPGVLEKINVPTLAIVSSADALIPSAEEGPRLRCVLLHTGPHTTAFAW